ncbi:MAG: MFS transporter [Rhizobiaceae bacterium]|nr:MFS transporter [Rhizobiaceae bacterium]
MTITEAKTGKAPFNTIVWPFAISQTISWATMFYIFPALMSEWERDLGWSKTEISGALTSALLLSALFAPIAGRIIDRGYFVTIHVGGTIAGVLLLLALSQVRELWQFYAVWSLMGIAISGVLYEPCFAILTRTFEKRARAAITRVTLVAGLAGTIAFPAVYALVEAFDWRTTLVIFALTLALLAIPLAWFASTKSQTYARTIAVETLDSPRHALKISRTLTFWLLVIAFIAFSLDHSMILTHILPLLSDRGVSPASAVLAASFIGPMQVIGRLAMMGVENRYSTVTIAVCALLALVVSAAVLLNADFWAGFIIMFVILQGAGNGVSSIIRPLLTAELLGRKNFGLISGVLALPFIGGFAFGPSLSALIWQWGGYDAVLLIAILICAIGIAALILAAKTASHRS